MFPLSGQLVIFSDDRPLVGQQFHGGFTCVNHWLYGESHAWLHFWASSRLSIMKDLWVVMENSSNTMTTVLTDDREAIALRVALDDMADVSEVSPWLHSLNAQVETCLLYTSPSPRDS